MHTLSMASLHFFYSLKHGAKETSADARKKYGIYRRHRRSTTIMAKEFRVPAPLLIISNLYLQ
jgi:hypothetical protein